MEPKLSTRPPSGPHSSSSSRSYPPGHPSRGSSSSHPHYSSSHPAPASSHHNHHHYHEEDRLGRSWRSLASSVVMSTQKAEKAASLLPNPPKEVLKELDEAVVTFLRGRIEWTRQIAHIEAKLQGKEQEQEAMDCYLRSQPRLGRKRRKLLDNNKAEITAAAAAAVAATSETAPQGEQARTNEGQSSDNGGSESQPLILE